MGLSRVLKVSRKMLEEELQRQHEDGRDFKINIHEVAQYVQNLEKQINRESQANSQ
jgi:hypothetical protein